ncbi:MAG: hypothetical protein ACREBS_04395, partial [Nitrososphaerales archaeon]
FLPSLGGKDENGSSSFSGSHSITQKMKGVMVLHSIKVATAFQTVPADALSKEERIDADVPITSEDKATYEKTAQIVKQVEGLRPVYLGSLELSSMAEGLTSVLLNIGMHNHLKSPTIKFLPAINKTDDG